jgi:hypothetical protein
MTLWYLATGSRPEPKEDEPEPVEPGAERDENFTREDFMRDLRKFVPQDDKDDDR